MIRGGGGGGYRRGGGRHLTFLSQLHCLILGLTALAVHREKEFFRCSLAFLFSVSSSSHLGENSEELITVWKLILDLEKAWIRNFRTNRRCIHQQMGHIFAIFNGGLSCSNIACFCFCFCYWKPANITFCQCLFSYQHHLYFEGLLDVSSHLHPVSRSVRNGSNGMKEMLIKKSEKYLREQFCEDVEYFPFTTERLRLPIWQSPIPTFREFWKDKKRILRLIFFCCITYLEEDLHIFSL